jgi:hypothetical protein
MSRQSISGCYSCRLMTSSMKPRASGGPLSACSAALGKRKKRRASAYRSATLPAVAAGQMNGRSNERSAGLSRSFAVFA